MAPVSSSEITRSNLARVLTSPVLRAFLPLAITGLALFVLFKVSQDINLRQVRSDFTAYGWDQLGLAFGAMVLSYLSLSLYDVVILRFLSAVRIPVYVPMLAGVASLAVSNLLGLSWLTGGTIRYRIYTAFGIDLAAVAKLMAFLWVAFFLGLSLLLGILLVFDPPGLSHVMVIPGSAETTIGIAILLGIGALFAWIGKKPRVFRFGSTRLELPPALAMAQLTLISVVDLAAASMVLYVLLPPDLAENLLLFFVVYVAAIYLGVLSHSPGGLGVFETTLLAGLGATGRSDILAALLMYRLIYFLVPFALAVIGLLGAWIFANRRSTTEGARLLFRVLRPIVPVLTATLALLAGAYMLISGNLPADVGRLRFLSEFLPLGLIETSHLLGSIIGLFLMILARGLYRRSHRAWVLAIGLTSAGLLLTVLKGIDLDSAALLALTLLGLLVFRSAFYRMEATDILRLSPRLLISLILLVACISWIGFFAYSRVEYSDSLWWQFALHGDASRFLRATVAVSVILAGVSLNSVMNHPSVRLEPESIPDAVKRLVAASPQTEAALALTGDKRFLIAPGQDAFLCYADTGSTLIAKGDPVGAREAGDQLIWALRDTADRMGRRCAYYAVSERFLTTYLDLGLQILKIGEIARVDLAGFTLDGPRRKDWRHAKARAGREGYEFAILSAAEFPSHLDALRRVSDAWLVLKNSDEKSFALGAFEPDYLANFDHAVMRQVTTGNIVAFATLLQGADKAELSLDLMRYDPAAPGMLMDALFAELMLWASGQGFKWFSLGAAPLSGLENRPLAPIWNKVGDFVYDHGERFYHFEGLRAFKQKFDPVWSPNYLACISRMDAPRILLEVNTLISGGLSGVIKRR